MRKTEMRKKSEAAHEWYMIDVSGKVLGRAATEISTLLSGKNRRDFTPNVDCGAGVIVTNCGKIRLTGEKERTKTYSFYSGYPGGLKYIDFTSMLKKDPKYAVRHAVRGMLPKSKLGDRMLKRLKLYVGSEHPHSAQKPKERTA